MDREIRDRWTAALRSGDFQQTKGKLHRAVAIKDSPAGYCCLGVLCDIMGVHKKRVKNLYKYEFPNGRKDAGMPPIDFAGLRANFGESDAYVLANMNDKGNSFAAIADWIEANIPVDDI